MSYTWGQIKLATLQKMYAADGSNIVEDESTKDYIAGMPYAANEGLMRLSTAGKFLVSSIPLAHMPMKNLIPDSQALPITDAKNLSFTGDKAHGYYFQYSGVGDVTISGGDSVITFHCDNPAVFTDARGTIANTANNPITLTFSSEYPFYVKNVALYADKQAFDWYPDYGKYTKYDLREWAQGVNGNSFYSLFDNSIVYESGATPVYLNTTDYYRESDHILVLPNDKPGMYTIYYNTYPGPITSDTPDTDVLDVDPEVAVLLPLYMASELYKDDDLALSTTLRNEFEVGLEALVNSSSNPGKEKFISEWV